MDIDPDILAEVESGYRDAPVDLLRRHLAFFMGEARKAEKRVAVVNRLSEASNMHVEYLERLVRRAISRNPDADVSARFAKLLELAQMPPISAIPASCPICGGSILDQGGAAGGWCACTNATCPYRAFVIPVV